MRDCRVETVDHVSDSDSEERDSNQPPTIALHPSHQGPPTYLLMSSKQEKVRLKKYTLRYNWFIDYRVYYCRFNFKCSFVYRILGYII